MEAPLLSPKQGITQRGKALIVAAPFPCSGTILSLKLIFCEQAAATPVASSKRQAANLRPRPECVRFAVSLDLVVFCAAFSQLSPLVPSPSLSSPPTLLIRAIPMAQRLCPLCLCEVPRPQLPALYCH